MCSNTRINRRVPRVPIGRRLLLLLRFACLARFSPLALLVILALAFLKLELAYFAQNFWRLRAIERSTERTNTFVDSAHGITSRSSARSKSLLRRRRAVD